MFFTKKKEQELKKGSKQLETFLNEDVDPTAEADVYLAYGRTAQAIEIIDEALNKGKISKQKYDNFILKNKLDKTHPISFNVLEKEIEVSKKIDLNYTYYVSITVGEHEKTTRQRLFIDLIHEINTKAGIEELEKFINQYIFKNYSKLYRSSTWVINNILEMKKGD